MRCGKTTKRPYEGPGIFRSKRLLRVSRFYAGWSIGAAASEQGRHGLCQDHQIQAPALAFDV
ncbi:MAG: hypothetical protein MUP44_00955, partial [Anaerolineales bacterium]|nr:hypothetical protein [Anaerolineales bacterium]